MSLKLESTGATGTVAQRMGQTWAVRIRYGRNFRIRVDSDEFRSKLFVLPDVDCVRVIIDAHLFKRNADLKEPNGAHG